MDERAAFPALAGEVAVERLLLRLKPEHSLYAASPGPGLRSPDAVLAWLVPHGVQGRLARVGPKDLRLLEFPTLLLLKDARWLLAIDMRRGDLIAEDSCGHEQALAPDRVTQHLDGLALDRTPPLPLGATLRARILRLVWQQRRMLAPAIAFALVAQMLSLLGPQLARSLVDDAFPEGSPGLYHAIIAGMVLIALFQSGARWVGQRLSQQVHIRVDATLERGLFAHILRLPYRYLEKKPLGQLLQGFQGITMSRSLLAEGAPGAILGGLTSAALLLMMSRMMPGPTAFVAVAGTAAAIIAMAAARRQHRLQQEVLAAGGRERGCAVEIFTHIATLKAAGAEDRAADRWLAALRSARHLKRHSDRLTQGSHAAIDLLGQLQLQCLWIWGGLRVIDGSLRLGELLGFTLMAGTFHAAVASLSKSFVSVGTLNANLEEAQSLLNTQPIAVAPCAVRTRTPPAVEIKDLWFRYDDTLPWVLAGVDLAVGDGRMYHVDGPSGFGKTTLLKLVAGFYEPSAGSIRIGSRSPGEMRQQMIYLSQGVRMFNASVLDNLRLFSGGAPYEQLMRTAEFTGLAQFVDELPMGYDTLLAHGGGNFSGGQRQLIALTGALASERSLLLLDEATANLDSACVDRLARTPLFAGKTILFSGHRRTRLGAEPRGF